MQGGEISKKINPEKANTTDFFLATWKVRCRVERTSVRDDKRKVYPVLPLFSMADGYIPQATDRISIEPSGGHSLRNFTVSDLLHTRHSWEAVGVCKGKLASTSMIDQHGDETVPYMLMNGVLIDENSPEFIAKMNQIIMFPPAAMLQGLEQIELAFNEFFENDNHTFRYKGPFSMLDRVQSRKIRLQNILFQSKPMIDAEIKTICSTMVQTHQQALDMKQKLELSIAMLEQADNKITKTHDQDIANRIIDSFRAGLRNAAFQNIAGQIGTRTFFSEISIYPKFYPKFGYSWESPFRAFNVGGCKQDELLGRTTGRLGYIRPA